MKGIFLASLFLFAANVFAVDNTATVACGTPEYDLSCTVPTARADGSSLSDSEIDKFEILRDSIPSGFTIGNSCVPYKLDLTVTPCNSTTIIQLITYDTDGNTSVPSIDRLLLTVGKSAPNPATDIR